MSQRQRPSYGGIPAHAEAKIAARRRRTDNAEGVPAPQPAPPPPPVPLSIEQRLKALERKVDALTEKLDLVLDVLTEGDASAAGQPSTKSSKSKRS